MSNTRSVNDILTDIVEPIIGDTPVSVQLNTALEHMASKGHVHPEYASKVEVDALRKELERLIELVGDISVSEQIAAAINKQA